MNCNQLQGVAGRGRLDSACACALLVRRGRNFASLLHPLPGQIFDIPGLSRGGWCPKERFSSSRGLTGSVSQGWGQRSWQLGDGLT